MSERQIEVLAFAGSLRSGSYNKALLRAAREVAPPEMSVEIADLAGIPLYDADVEEAGDPEVVQAFKERIRAADALLIATPEYNHGVAAVTKNAVDWASRPPKSAPLDRKPIGILGASPGVTGTARAQSQLRQSFVFTNSYCMPQPEILVYRAHEKFDAEGRLTDDRTREYLAKYMRALAEWARRFR
jgi:chromate reductase